MSKSIIKIRINNLIMLLLNYLGLERLMNDPESLLESSLKTDWLKQWTDWQWQDSQRITDIETFENFLSFNFSVEEKEKLQQTINKFPLSITPYYLSLINTDDIKNDPVFKQAFPSSKELLTEKYEMKDPLAEERDSPVDGITHRYPDRILFHVSNICAMYCRHCTRKRKVGKKDLMPTKAKLMEGIKYIERTSAIRDVLLSGGDPLMLPDEFLDWLLWEIKKIPHVEIIRIGTRIPVVLPFRITDSLIKVLKKYQPLWINTQFNHPQEFTKYSKEAIAKLADAGFPLGNQSVLLSGVNDSVEVMKNLVHRLVENRIRPYYIYQCDLSEGLSHFRTPVSKGIEIMEHLRGHTSGLAVPTYVIDSPGGGGKIPIAPTYLISSSTDEVILRNYNGKITAYKETDFYKKATSNNGNKSEETDKPKDTVCHTQRAYECYKTVCTMQDKD